MIRYAQAIAQESFTITGRGILLELQHDEDGIPMGAMLISQKSGNSWIIKARVLFEHALQEQQRFDNESVEYILVKFNSPLEQRESLESIKKRESQYIFKYFISSVGHDEKPQQLEKLIISDQNEKSI